MSGEAYAYRLVPVLPDPPGAFRISTAALMVCAVTGRTLSGSGGGGTFLAPEVAELVLHDPEVRAVLLARLAPDRGGEA